MDAALIIQGDAILEIGEKPKRWDTPSFLSGGSCRLQKLRRIVRDELTYKTLGEDFWSEVPQIVVEVAEIGRASCRKEC